MPRLSIIIPMSPIDLFITQIAKHEELSRLWIHADGPLPHGRGVGAQLHVSLARSAFADAFATFAEDAREDEGDDGKAQN